MTELYRLPVGIESFEEIRKNEFYYIDKTKLIEQLLETGVKLIFSHVQGILVKLLI